MLLKIPCKEDGLNDCLLQHGQEIAIKTQLYLYCFWSFFVFSQSMLILNLDVLKQAMSRDKEYASCKHRYVKTPLQPMKRN